MTVRGKRGRNVEVVVHEQLEADYSDAGDLSEEEMAEIEAEALAEVEEEARTLSREAYRRAAVKAARKRAQLEEEDITLTIDVAGHAQCITLDGTKYHHGHVYTVPYSVAAVLFDIMERTWRHESEVGGANANEYRQPVHTQINMQTGQQSHGAASVVNSSASFMSQGRRAPRVQMAS